MAPPPRWQYLPNRKADHDEEETEEVGSSDSTLVLEEEMGSEAKREGENEKNLGEMDRCSEKEEMDERDPVTSDEKSERRRSALGLEEVEGRGGEVEKIFPPPSTFSRTTSRRGDETMDEEEEGGEREKRKREEETRRFFSSLLLLPPPSPPDRMEEVGGSSSAVEKIRSCDTSTLCFD